MITCIPIIGFVQDNNASELMKSARYRGQTQKEVDPFLIRPKVADFVQKVIVSHLSDCGMETITQILVLPIVFSDHYKCTTQEIIIYEVISIAHTHTATFQSYILIFMKKY